MFEVFQADADLTNSFERRYANHCLIRVLP
jgi:hypothetical protein